MLVLFGALYVAYVMSQTIYIATSGKYQMGSELLVAMVLSADVLQAVANIIRMLTGF